MTDITIPDEVAIAARDAWTHGPKDPIEAFRAALRAGLAAWPGMQPAISDGAGRIVALRSFDEMDEPEVIILPLPQEKTDDKA